MNENLLRLIGNLLGVGGALVCAIAGGARLAGGFHLVGLEAMTLFVVGIGLLASGCFVKLHVLEQRLQQD